MADKFLVERAQEEKRDLTEDEIAELRLYQSVSEDAAKNTLKGILQEQHCGGGFPDSQESGVIHDFYVPEVCTIEVRVSNALTGWQKVKVPFTVKSIALLKEGCHPLNLPCLNTEGFDLEGMLSFDEDNESAA
ncbi:hypothetical protein Q5752_004233 [Cryptotrichosporon argae]